MGEVFPVSWTLLFPLRRSRLLAPRPGAFGVITEGSISLNSGETVSLSRPPGAVTPRIPVEVSVLVAVWARRIRVNTGKFPLQPCKGFIAEELAAPGFNTLHLLLFPSFVAESMQDPSLQGGHWSSTDWERDGRDVAPAIIRCVKGINL